MQLPSPTRRATEALARLSPGAFAGLLLAVAVLTRLPLLLTDLINVDEGVWWMAAKLWLGGATPYVDFTENKPPAIFALYALPQIVGTDSLYPVHLLAILWQGATAWLVGCFAAELVPAETKTPVRRTAAILYLLLSAAGSSRQFLFLNTETGGLLPLAGGLWLYTKARLNKDHLGRLFTSGALVSVACFFRQPLGVVPVLMGLDLILPAKNIDGGFARRLAKAAVFSLGGTLPAGMIVFYLHAAGALEQAIYWVFLINQEHIHLSPGFTFQAIRFAKNVLPSILIAAPCWAALALAVTRSRPAQDLSQRLLLLWSLVTLALLWTASLAGRWTAHYYLPTLAPLAVVAIVSLENFFAESKERIRAAMLVLAAGGTLVFSGAGTAQVLRGSFEETSPRMKKAAARIASLTEPSDRIYIWGFGHTLYYRSRRLSASRFMIPYTSISGYMFGAQEAFDETDPTELINPEHWRWFMDDLRKARPALFLDYAENDVHHFGRHRIERYPELAAWLSEGYRRLPTDGPVVFYQRKDRAESEP